MKYHWLDESLTAEKLSLLVGKPVKSITQGEIVIGYEPDGEPITQRGIEIEVDGELNTEQLNVLDLNFINIKRAGGKTLAERIVELESKIKA
jgi:hypothetical protein